MPNPDGSETFEEFRDFWIEQCNRNKAIIDEIEVRYAYKEYEAILTGERDKIDKAVATAQYYLWQRNNWMLN